MYKEWWRTIKLKDLKYIDKRIPKQQAEGTIKKIIGPKTWRYRDNTKRDNWNNKDKTNKQNWTRAPQKIKH